MGRSLRNLRAVGSRRRWLIAEAMIWLLIARLALVFLPFPRLARGLGDLAPPADPRVAAAGAATTPRAAELAREVSWAVTRGAVHAPFRAVCLPRAMAARIMLKRRGVASAMHFGATVGAREIDGHAWLDAAGVRVTGYPVAAALTEIACFV